MRRLVLLALLVSGCGLFDDDGETTLAKNHARWRALGVHDYDFRYQRSCFCGWTDPVIIEVRGDTVASVRVASTGESPPVGAYYWWPTVDSLFVWLKRDYAANYNLSITYDETYRFPAFASGDIPNAADDEFTMTATAFVAR